METKEESSIKEEGKEKEIETEKTKNSEKNEKINEKLIKELDNLCELKHQLDLSHTKINTKSINKILKEKPFSVPLICLQKKKEILEEKNKQEKDGFNCCQYYMLPSGITKMCSKNFKTGEEKDEKIDYSSLDSKVYEKFKKTQQEN